MPAFTQRVLPLVAWILAGSIAAAAQTDPLPAGLEPHPLEIEVFGLSFHPPAGATVLTEKVGLNLRVSLTDSNEAAIRTWTLRIAPIAARHPGIDAAGQIDDYLRRLDATRSQHRVLVNEAVGYGNGGHLALLEQQGQTGPSIAGWLVMNTGDKPDEAGRESFLVFSISARSDQLERVRSVLEASFSTISITSVQELALARRARLERGRTFLESVTPAELEALAGSDQWLRIYRPADPATGANEQELGYSHVQIEVADRFAIDSDEPSAGFDEPGLLVRVHARVILDPDDELFYDTAAEYWLGLDRAETWTVRATQRRRSEPLQSSAETGVRTIASTSEPRPKLTVITQSDRQRARDPYQWEVPDVYLSQVLSWVLASLLPTDSDDPIELSYYYYFPNPQPRLTLRRDSWAPVGDGSGQWVLTTLLSSASAPVESVHAADGTLVRRQRADGTVTVPIELDDLEKLWRRKGMNMKRTGR